MSDPLKRHSVRSTFGHDMAALNGLDDFGEWFFYSGMMFGRYEKWWGAGGERPEPHEGLDIYYYRTNDGVLRALAAGAKVPAMFDGLVYEISDDDYLGKSIFVRHDAVDSNGHILHSVYAHSIPVEGLFPGREIKKGEFVAHVADIRDRKMKIPGHLHVSMVYLAPDYPKDMLKWSLLSISYSARLVDPIGYLECEYSTGEYTP